MSVLDASALTEALTADTAIGQAARERVAQSGRWDGPAILPAEVLSAIRGMVVGRKLRVDRADVARARLRRMRLRLHSFGPFEERMWDLRMNLTVYDAWYVAIAERLEVSLVTTDAKLARVRGVLCPIEVVPPA